jgi:hypothetical protein
MFKEIGFLVVTQETRFLSRFHFIAEERRKNEEGRSNKINGLGN